MIQPSDQDLPATDLERELARTTPYSLVTIQRTFAAMRYAEPDKIADFIYAYSRCDIDPAVTAAIMNEVIKKATLETVRDILDGLMPADSARLPEPSSGG